MKTHCICLNYFLNSQQWMTFKKFQQSKKLITLLNQDGEKEEGYSYSPCDSKETIDHHWISKFEGKFFLILGNSDYLDADLPKLEKMLFEFIYGAIESK